MRGKKHRGGRGKKRKRGGPSGAFPSQGARQEFTGTYEEAEDEIEGSDPMEREGSIAVDFLTRKIQLRKLVDAMKFQDVENEDEEYSPVRDNRFSVSPVPDDDGERVEVNVRGKEGNGPASSKTKPDKGPASSKTKPDKGPASSKTKPDKGPASSKTKPDKGPASSKTKPDKGPASSKTKPDKGPASSKTKPDNGPASSKTKPDDGRKKSELEDESIDIIEDEEVLRIIGELEKEVDTSFTDLVDISDAESEFSDPNGNQKNEESSGNKADDAEKLKRKKIRISFEDTKDGSKTHLESDLIPLLNRPVVSPVTLETHKPKPNQESDLMPIKKVLGLVNHGPYSRVLYVGDSRLELLEKHWPECAYIRPQFLFKPGLMLDEVKDFILSQTDLLHLENGTLLICNVGLYDLIKFTDYEDCLVIKDHKPMKIISFKEKSVTDLCKIVMLKLNRAYEILEKTLDSSSVICFSAIIPCDPVLFFDMESKHHTPAGHTTLSPVFQDELKDIKDKLHDICEKVNKQLYRFCSLPSLWSIMESYKFYDGVNVSMEVIEPLSLKLNVFLQELFYGLEISKTSVEFNQEREIIVVGDSRLMELEKIWCGDKPEFHCQADLGFYNFEDYINKNLVGLKDKVVLVCLGLNDLIQFKDDVACDGEGHEPNKVAVPCCEKYETLEKCMEKIAMNIESSINAFCKNNSSLLFFATSYPFNLDEYMTSQVVAHKEKIGHDIPMPEKNSQRNKNLNESLNRFNSHLRFICSCLSLPVWDMHRTVCQNDALSVLGQEILKDGIYPYERIAEELIRSYYFYVNMKLNHDCIENSKVYKFQYRPMPNLAKSESDKHYPARPIRRKDVQGTTTNKAPRKSRFDIVNPVKNIPPSGSKRPSSTKPSYRELKVHASPPRRHARERSRTPEYHSSRAARKHRSPSPANVSRRPNVGHSSFEERTHSRKQSHRPSHRSPERLSRARLPSQKESDTYRFSRLPEGVHRSSRPSHSSGESFHKHREHQNDKYHRHPKGEDKPGYEIFFNTIKKECRREKDFLIQDALLDLCDSHTRECERYLDKPDKHPDYNKEYRLFIEKKRIFIIDLGGDPFTYNYLRDWGNVWPTRLIELFQESWSIKKEQCISMITSRKRRSASSSSTSESSSSSHRKRKRSKKKSSRPSKASLSPEPKRGNLGKESNKWKALDSSINNDKAQNVEKKAVKVVEVLGILTYMKDKLGVFGMPVSLLYEKAVSLEKKGSDPNSILEDVETAMLLTVLKDKFVTIIEEDEGSAIQKAIMLEAQSLLKELLDEASRGKKKKTSQLDMDYGQIARLTMGQTISETIATIKNFFLYEGHSDVSAKTLESAYTAVKDEQLKVNNSAQQIQGSLSEKSRFRSDFLPPVIGLKPVSNSVPLFSKPPPSASTSSFNSEFGLDEEFFAGRKFMKPSVRDPNSNTRTNVKQQNVEKRAVKVVKVLGLLTNMKNRLGDFERPVSILYKRAVSLEKKGSDPNSILDDDETAMLITVLNNKFVTLIEEGEGSAIQKAIMLEAESFLKELLDEIARRKRSSSQVDVNYRQIARLTMGQTISETIMTIKNFLLYEGYSDVSADKLESIYVAVKDEQMMINIQERKDVKESTRTSQFRRGLLPPEDELTEEFFIGQKSVSNPGSRFSKPPPSASTSRFNSDFELDEEFFTGRKFMKPNFSDPVSNVRTSDAEKRSYVPHRHILPPPAPLISGSHFARSSPRKPETQASGLDFDMMRKCLATLKSVPQ